MLRINIRAIGIGRKLSWLILPAVVFAIFLNVPTYSEIAVDFTTRLEEATSCLTDGQYIQAEQLYREVSEQNPGTDVDLKARKGLAIACAAQKKDSDVDVVVDRLIADFPGNQEVTRAVCNVGDQYYSKQGFARASQLFRRVINECPKNNFSMWAQCGVANSNLQLGEDTAAETAIDKLIADYSEQENVAMAVCLIADNYRKLQKTEKAAEVYQKVVKKWPTHEYAMWAQSGIADLRIRQGESVAAAAAVDKLIADYSGHGNIAMAVCLLADDYHELQNREKANELYVLISEKWQAHEYAMWARMHLAMSNIECSNLATAEAMVDDLFTNYSQFPDFIRAVCYIAGRYYDWQAFDRAEQLYQRIAAMHPETVQEVWSQAASLILNIRLTDVDISQASIDKFQADFASDPDMPEALFWLGEIYYRKGVLLEEKGLSDQARDRFLKAVALLESNIHHLANAEHQRRAYCGIAFCYLHLGRNEEAKPIYDLIIKQYPGTREAERAAHHRARLENIDISDSDKQQAISYLESQHSNWLQIYNGTGSFRFEIIMEGSEGKELNGVLNFIVSPNDSDNPDIPPVTLQVELLLSNIGRLYNENIYSLESKWSKDDQVESTLTKEEVNLICRSMNGLFYPFRVMACTYPVAGWQNNRMIPKRMFFLTRGHPIRQSTPEETEQLFKGENQYLFYLNSDSSREQHWISAENGEFRMIKDMYVFKSFETN